MSQWTYRVVEVEGNFGPGALDRPNQVLERHLESMGREGWELTGIVPAVYRRNAEHHRRELVSALLCFKRLAPEG